MLSGKLLKFPNENFGVIFPDFGSIIVGGLEEGGRELWLSLDVFLEGRDFRRKAGEKVNYAVGLFVDLREKFEEIDVGPTWQIGGQAAKAGFENRHQRLGIAGLRPKFNQRPSDRVISSGALQRDRVREEQEPAYDSYDGAIGLSARHSDQTGISGARPCGQCCWSYNVIGRLSRSFIHWQKRRSIESRWI
jgi:hypothetical protein